MLIPQAEDISQSLSQLALRAALIKACLSTPIYSTSGSLQSKDLLQKMTAFLQPFDHSLRNLQCDLTECIEAIREEMLTWELVNVVQAVEVFAKTVLEYSKQVVDWMPSVMQVGW